MKEYLGRGNDGFLFAFQKGRLAGCLDSKSGRWTAGRRPVIREGEGSTALLRRAPVTRSLFLEGARLSLERSPRGDRAGSEAEATGALSQAALVSSLGQRPRSLLPLTSFS